MGVMMSIPYALDECSAIYNVRDLNSSFALGSIKVMYTGPNRNGSSFSKESVTRALPSLKNVPIVCHYDYEENEIGGHDVEAVLSEDGNVTIRNLTSPIGVVPEAATYRFETSEDESGNEHEYLVVDGVILWKRQDAYNHIVNDLDGHVSHSMEINVKDGDFDSKTGLYSIADFEFTALCLLENVTPCFQGSALQLFSIDSISEQMEQMAAELKEIKNLFSTINAFVDQQALDIEKLNIEKYQSEEEGGETVLEEKLALLAEYGLDIDSLDFAINDYSVEELREKFEAMKEDPTPAEDEAEEAVDEEDESEEQNFELSNNFNEYLWEAVAGLGTISAPWGEEPRYSIVDYDMSASKVYLMDCEDWRMYGFDYSRDGDAVVIDVDTKARVKWAIVEYDEGEQPLPFSGMFERVADKINEFNASYNELAAEKDSITSEYEAMSSSVNELSAEVESLRQYKADVEHAAKMAKIADVLGRFADLDGIDAFESIKEHAEEFDIEALEEKCFAIRGRNNTVAKYSYEPKSPKIIVTQGDNRDSDNSDAPYGGIVEYYEAKHY